MNVTPWHLPTDSVQEIWWSALDYIHCMFYSERSLSLYVVHWKFNMCSNILRHVFFCTFKMFCEACMLPNSFVVYVHWNKKDHTFILKQKWWEFHYTCTKEYLCWELAFELFVDNLSRYLGPQLCIHVFAYVWLHQFQKVSHPLLNELWLAGYINSNIVCYFILSQLYLSIFQFNDWVVVHVSIPVYIPVLWLVVHVLIRLYFSIMVVHVFIPV